MRRRRPTVQVEVSREAAVELERLPLLVEAGPLVLPPTLQRAPLEAMERR